MLIRLHALIITPEVAAGTVQHFLEGDARLGGDGIGGWGRGGRPTAFLCYKGMELFCKFAWEKKNRPGRA